MGTRYFVETGEASRVIIDCEKIVRSREIIMVSVKLKKREVAGVGLGV